MKKVLINSISIFVLLTLSLSGCTTSKISNELPVANLTSYEKVSPSRVLNETALPNSQQLLSKLSLVDSNGKSVSIMDSKRPVIFEAFWCPHCQRTLLLFAHNKKLMQARPIVVSTGYPGNVILQEAVATSEHEFKLLGIIGFDVYYHLGPISNVLVPSFPTLLIQKDKSVEIMSGEHTQSVWLKAVNNEA